MKSEEERARKRLQLSVEKVRKKVDKLLEVCATGHRRGIMAALSNMRVSLQDMQEKWEEWEFGGDVKIGGTTDE